jgi:hypothetical protein
MSNNTLTGLNDHLFAALERLGKNDLAPEQLEIEVQRASAIVSVADQITSNADLQLKAAKLFGEHGNTVLPMLPKIGRGQTDEG